MNDYEWIVEIRAIPDTEPYKLFKRSKTLGTHKGQEYYHRFLDWAPATTKDIATPDTDGHTLCSELPPQQLESCIDIVSRKWNKHYQFRIVNIRTREIIPGELFQ